MSKISVIVTACIALAGCILMSVAVGMPEWSKVTSLAGVQSEIGLWDWPSDTYCNGWIVATITMCILAAIFFFFTFIAAVLVLINKKPWSTKKLRLIVFCLSLITLLFAFLGWIFYVCFSEWSPCWLNGVRGDKGSAYTSIKYGASFIWCTTACGLAGMMCITAAWMVGSCPLAPPISEELEEVPEMMPYSDPYTTAYAPAPYYSDAIPPAYTTYPMPSYAPLGM